jgi:hypothetical protein
MIRVIRERIFGVCSRINPPKARRLWGKLLNAGSADNAGIGNDAL